MSCNIHATATRHNRPAPKAKVKSGCKTCKSRKVKCDESRPACNRCISTGRVCEGYGIWGGGGNLYSSRPVKEACMLLRQPPSLASLISPSGIAYLEWFKCRVAPKIPGSFLSRFWDTLVLQASSDEPAVLHAILALSSVHRIETVKSRGQHKSSALSTEQDLFPVQHYVKAIQYLRSHLAVEDRMSCRVTLITCVVFVVLELLRGQFKMSQNHLQKGINILKQMKKAPDTFQDSCDNWILEIMSRLHLQVQLFKHIHHHPNVDWYIDTDVCTPTLVFHSTKEAWFVLEAILRKVFRLGYDARRCSVSEQGYTKRSHALVERQICIQEDLAHWRRTHEASIDVMQRHMTEEELNGARIPITYNILATIMAYTCLEPGNEMIHDAHTDLFLSMIKRLADAWAMILTIVPLIHPLPGHRVDMAISIMDVGWIPPLYYTAINCRNHRIRLQAVRLLECTSHREGLWDASIAAVITRKVMELEEKGFYRDLHAQDDFPLTAHPQLEDLTTEALPSSHRLREIDVEMIGDPVDRISLFCKREHEGNECRVLLSKYNLRTQCWVNSHHV
ncbi:hypothetical protein K431DRAFT_336390 [Polychaeton citri CBS 116435]|uniref:Zn(2)-C6 fungal-type domain-containing protein n=1 Tax=Polychaeton citri CBS 116435 TaxID=1314669 RepID=A0A9P4QCU7_9PEZI|nr:hypothetical protein K431DRAFT_336390 [Polychaeton citri CBS 116435]